MYNILLPTDGSPGALRAAGYVATLCASLKEPAVTILYVKDIGSISVSPIASFTGLGGIAVRPDALDWPKLQASLESAATEALEETKKVLEDIEGPVKLQAETGKPAEVICQVAEKGRFDLIIVGSRGLGGFSGLMLGSVSNQVLHRSKVPVLVIH